MSETPRQSDAGLLDEATAAERAAAVVRIADAAAAKNGEGAWGPAATVAARLNVILDPNVPTDHELPTTPTEIPTEFSVGHTAIDATVASPEVSPTEQPVLPDNVIPLHRA